MKGNNSFDLVKANANNLSEIQRLLESCRLPGSDITKGHLKHFYVLKKASEALGCIGLEIYDGHGLLRSLAVMEKYRSKGFGRLLVRQIEQYAKEQHIDDIYLLTTTAADFFRRLGYSKTSRENIPPAVKKSEEFSSICPDSAVAMVKAIPNLYSQSD